MFRDLPCLRAEDETFTVTIDPVVEEIAVSLTVNGRNLMTAMASPDSLEEFIIGFLFTEQIIRSFEEIESIRREKNSFSVLTTNPFRVLGQKKIILSGCGGTSSSVDARRLPHIASTRSVEPREIRAALKELTDSEQHQKTGGLHRVGLTPPEGPLHLVEDIGRHNALDKAIGFGLRERLPLAESYVVSSGRISSEMVRKCLVAGIPLVVSQGATTTLAIEIAQQTGLCVVGFAGRGKMNIYTHPEHIRGAPPTGEHR
ncbi:MAG: formate dehydrogenase accessory sulfurtransferase FdhD [Methanomicrobiales archaeon]|nr:formate dehydrogenase accessory sulfurtransferase FdhD [Methanomicrobiales archaeon]